MSNKNAKNKSEDKAQLYVNKTDNKSDCVVNGEKSGNAENSTAGKRKDGKERK